MNNSLLYFGLVLLRFAYSGSEVGQDNVNPTKAADLLILNAKVVTLESELEPIIEILAKNQWVFRIHATYNERIARFLDIFEKVEKQYPFLNQVRWIIDQAETISDENLQRIKETSGGIIESIPSWSPINYQRVIKTK